MTYRIEISHIETAGFEAAMRGMRNSYKSHSKANEEADRALARKLVLAGPEHRKFLRQMMIWMDINAPLYWWKQMDAYKVGITQNSESTMHTLMKRELSPDDFVFEDTRTKQKLLEIIRMLNIERFRYEQGSDDRKQIEKSIICLLPSGYKQKRTICMTYETARNIYQQRVGHKLAEWEEFCKVLEQIPHSELITL